MVKNSKQEILNKILKETYCRLMPSEIQGVGVFAVKDIPKSANPFPDVPKQKWVAFKESDFAKAPIGIKKMLSAFFVSDKKGKIFIAEGGLNNIDISFYINHSKSPNLITRDDGENFITRRKIKKGEELTVDYSTYAPDFQESLANGH